jgi:hypothetical protein
VSIARDGDDFTVAFQPENHVIRVPLRHVCRKLRWKIIEDKSSRKTWRACAHIFARGAPILLPTGLFGRVSVDVHHALNLVTTGPASENLSLVIEIGKSRSFGADDKLACPNCSKPTSLTRRGPDADYGMRCPPD